jgi:hypothetical protein
MGKETGKLPGSDSFCLCHHYVSLHRVIRIGSKWESEKFYNWYGGIVPHIARCSAALNLGALKDPRAFEPLVNMLKNGDYLENKFTITYPEKNKFNIRRFAAQGLGYLKDKQATDPLISALQDNDIDASAAMALGDLADPKAVDALIKIVTKKEAKKELRGICINALIKIRDMRTLPAILQTSDELGCVNVGHSMIYVTRVTFDRNWIDERWLGNKNFPQMGGVESDLKVWQYWLNVGGKEYTDNVTREAYRQWKKIKQENPQNAKAAQYYLHALRNAGVAALPFIIQKIQEGDTELIQLILDLVGYDEIKPDSKPQDVLAWWQANKDRWTVPFKNQ